MKRLLTYVFALLTCSVYGQFDLSNPRLWMRDGVDNGNLPSIEWGINPQVGYSMWTGGSQNVSNQGALNTVTVSTTYARTGQYSYRFYVEKPNVDYPAQKDIRGEWMWLDPGRQQTYDWEWRWSGVSILIPPEFAFETRRVMIAYDHKESPDDQRTPFGLLIQNGRYHISGRMVGPDGYIEDMGPVERGVWVDWLLERNWSCGPDGYMRFYKNGQVKWAKYGANIPCRGYDAPLCRIQHGFYKWIWQSPDGLGEGVGAPLSGERSDAPTAPLILYMDEIRFGKTTATLADMLVGGTPANTPPSVNAGNNIVINAPTSTANLVGSATDADGTVVSYLWTKVSGPSGGTIFSSGSASTSISSLVVGTYVYQLQATDDDGGTGLDQVTVTVNPAQTVNAPPTVYAGDNKTITLPLDSFYMDGGPGGINATDPEGGALTYKWRVELGGGTIETPNALNTWITGLPEGENKFWITVTDPAGDTATDFVFIYVLPEPEADYPPVAQVVPSTQTITLPLDSASFDASTSYVTSDSIQTYAWTKLSGPAGGSIRLPSNPFTYMYDMEEGTYVFRLILTAYNGLKDTADVTVTVNPEPVNAPPVITWNSDSTRSIRFPKDSVLLQTTITDDVSISQIIWTKVSGPPGGFIVSGTSDDTYIKNLLQSGTYVYAVQAIDDEGATTTKYAYITVEGNYIFRFILRQGGGTIPR